MTKNNYTFILTLALSCLTVFALFVWQGNTEFSLKDEGFLWYGAQRVMLGEVPIRDFMAYDPGRYYWSAVLMDLLRNNGIVSLRISVALFQVLGLYTGLLLIARSEKNKNFLFLLIACATLALWMFPRHKLFDISLSIFSIGILTYLIENPTNMRFFLTGLAVGFIAIFGRNHGIYAVLGTLGVMLWLNIKKTEHIQFFKNFFHWALGIVVGFSPLLVMLVLVPGFAAAFCDSIRVTFEIKSTNLPLPVPWPWTMPVIHSEISDSIRGILVGIFFTFILAFGVASICGVIWKKITEKQIPSALVAASFLVLPYAQLAYSRAEVNHLAQGIFPFLIACLILLSTQSAKVKWPLTTLLFVTTIWVMLPNQPGWLCVGSKQCVTIIVSNDSLKVDQPTATDVALLRELAAQYAPNNQSFLAAPLWPGAYALLERKSPVWEIYPLFARSQDFEQTEITRIKNSNPGFAIIFDLALDGQESMRFKNTHPLINQYILNNFDPIPNSVNPAYQVFKAKELAR